MFAKVNKVLPDGYILLVWPKPYKPQRWIVKYHDKTFNAGDYLNYDHKRNTLETQIAFKNCQFCLLPHHGDIEVCSMIFTVISLLTSLHIIYFPEVQYYYSYAIKPGFYENTCQLLQKMQQSIKSSIMKRIPKPPKWTPTLLSNPQSVTLNMNNTKRKDGSQYFVFGGDVKDSLLRDLELCASEKTMVAKLDINN